MHLSQVAAALRSILSVASILSLVSAAGFAQVTDPPTVYNSIPNGLLHTPPTAPGNVASLGFQAVQVKEFGDGLNLAPGNRSLTTVSVVMSSWACPSANPPCVTPPGAYVVDPGLTVPTFDQPIRLNIYATNGATPPEPGALLATSLQTFQIPYRPSTDARCAGGGWFSSSDNSCHSGVATKITFDFTSQGVTLPDRIIVGVTFNTSTSGYSPLGTGTACFSSPQGCPYDSLNVSADNSATAATAGNGVIQIGSPIDPDGVYVTYTPPSSLTFACSPASPAAVGNQFLLDTGPGCWTFNHPEIMVNTGPASAAADGAFQVKVFPNLSAGDSVINIGNTGASAASSGAFGAIVGGNLCVNVYVFSPDEQEVACCTCSVTPNGVQTVSARQLISKTLTPAVPTAITVKLLATAAPAAGTACNASTPGALAPGLIAFGTNLHAAAVGGSTTAGTFSVTETPFIQSSLSAAELTRISTLCGFIASNGTGFGVCPGCTAGAAGAAKQ